MSPDAHWYIHRAEQAAHRRAQARHAVNIPRSRQPWAAKVRSMFDRRRDHAHAVGPQRTPGRGALWRRT
jgi:hypothetical protein